MTNIDALYPPVSIGVWYGEGHPCPDPDSPHADQGHPAEWRMDAVYTDDEDPFVMVPLFTISLPLQ